MAEYGLRAYARHLLLATSVAEATGLTKYITLRDNLINLWLQSPDWDSRGMYFFGEYQTDYVLGSGAYASGKRIQSTWHIGILAEAFAQAYRATGNSGLKEKLVAMGNYVSTYGLNPSHNYAEQSFGFNKATPLYYGGCSPAYTTQLVNTVVYAYKFSGTQALLKQAKIIFNRGTKGAYGTCARTASDTSIHHFVDTRFASGDGYYYLDYNKGELFYTYMLFENGGNPYVDYQDTEAPSPPANLRIN
jgi:hypothetical protein